MPVVGSAERHVGVFELPLDQGFDRDAVGLRQRRKTRGGADLRRCQALALGQPGGKGLRHGHAFERAPHQLFTRARRRRFELQMVGKATPERRVDLLDAVGDPQRRHRVRFQNLVDPGLAADTARRRPLFGTRHELGGFGADRREHVFDLIEQQRGFGAAFEEHLRDLQRAVAVAPAQ